MSIILCYIGIVGTIWIALTGLIGAIRLSYWPLFIHSINYICYCAGFVALLISFSADQDIGILSPIGVFFGLGLIFHIVFEVVLKGRRALYDKGITFSDLLFLRQIK